MKTLIIWDNTTEAMRFHIIDGDYSKLNNIYVNSNNTEEHDNLFDDIQMKLAGVSIEVSNECALDVKGFEEFPIDEFRNDPDIKSAIVCGFAD